MVGSGSDGGWSGGATAKSDLRAQETQLKILQLQLKSQDRRELLTAKREVYSKLLAEVDAAYTAAEAIRVRQQKPDSELLARIDALQAVVVRAGAVAAEVAVLAGPKVFAAASKTLGAIYKYSAGESSIEELTNLRAAIIFALHQDINSDV
ncbi:hypothetical protein ACWEOR_10970 [Micromonospora chalcea]